MKRFLSGILCLCMLFSLLSTNVFAAATDISVTSADYHDNGDVKSINISFGWSSSSASGRLTVMTERLRSAGEPGTNKNYGDFTDLGYYSNQFNSWDAVIAEEDAFGILYYTDEENMKQLKTNSISLNFDKGDIPINVDKTYYVYLWTYWNGQYYPDNLFMVLQIKDGQLQYATAKDRNDYGSFTVLEEGASNSQQVLVNEEKPNNEVSSNTGEKNEMTPAIPAKYEYISYPEATGQANLNANLFLNDKEFISADNTYYFVGSKDGQIDPVVYQKIDNIVSYAYYNHSISPGNTQRNLVAADGTLYGVTWKGEKKVLATNVKKTSMNHYLTKDGKLIELTSGKVIATDCKDFAEANTAWTIGAIKNDGSFWLGYTYKGDATAYKRGLEKKLDSAKLVVPEGVVDSNNRFYRWNETVTKMGMDENAWSMGFFQEKNDYKVDLVYVCDNAYRVFPSEKLSKIGVTSEERVHETITGFVLTKSGDLYGYGFWYNEKFGNFGMVEEIFTLRETATDGNFVGIKSEGSNVINAIVCRACDYKRYIQGKVYDRELNTHPEFYTVTRNGFLATNGKVYSVDRDSEGVKDSEIWATPNQDADFGQMHRGTQTFKAYAFGKDTTINLLPSVTSWAYDNSNICLLERKDGSVWMAAFYRNGRNAAITESLGGYENTNAIQITNPTTTAGAPDYISVDGEAKPVKTGFLDVAADAWYAAPVQWAVDKGITAGTSATTFSPDNTCTRAQILTFLWRAVGSPKMSGANPFSDVMPADYYYDAAIWASQMGMVSGNRFEGGTPCTRSATVVYLWKNAGSPFASYNGNFTDVSAGSDYAQAVAWAVNNGVTSGTSATTFSPDTTCTRGQIVTFLMRALNK